MSNTRFPVYFIPHGGGPWPFMENLSGVLRDDDPWKPLEVFLRGMDKEIGRRPKAVLVISAHWPNVPKLTVSTAAHPGMYFDYGGFPAHTYQLKYPAPGAPAIAEHVRDVLKAKGIETETNDSRGYDHGVFIPFMLIYPKADVPIIMMSLDPDLSAETHFRIGQALESLRDEDILIVGSGLSYHNMRMFFRRNGEHEAQSARFDDWLADAVSIADPEARLAKLATWTDNPDAIASHFPEHDHLVPVFAAAGAAGSDTGVPVLKTDFLNKRYSAYRFG
ncbi:class III extradiol ring-cleavage dioxygenase [Martelella sp. HB161492]|uniref:DODA-type extradiol aromatic ring-opening family dioxygenase n=1 Tax=Martelella sp. HB161492 TaxID=2720726 RepID=UPI0015924C93|nr:class III extradiol ring-cleavage dioxygenase [Martelella sp. HB161492]